MSSECSSRQRRSGGRKAKQERCHSQHSPSAKAVQVQADAEERRERKCALQRHCRTFVDLWLPLLRPHRSRRAMRGRPHITHAHPNAVRSARNEARANALQVLMIAHKATDAAVSLTTLLHCFCLLFLFAAQSKRGHKRKQTKANCRRQLHADGAGQAPKAVISYRPFIPLFVSPLLLSLLPKSSE